MIIRAAPNCVSAFRCLKPVYAYFIDYVRTVQRLTFALATAVCDNVTTGLEILKIQLQWRWRLNK